MPLFIHPTRSWRRRQDGVGLIEVLVSLLVLCFGMLGLVGLQLFSLRHNQGSLERGMAVVQSHSILDAMRADRANAISGAFDIGIDDKTPTGATFAQRAVAAWRAELSTTLGPDATGSVDCTDALCTIRVRWDDTRAGGVKEHIVETQVQL